MITITIEDHIAEYMLDYLEFNSDVNCSEGPMTPTNEYSLFRDCIRAALEKKEVDGE